MGGNNGGSNSFIRLAPGLLVAAFPRAHDGHEGRVKGGHEILLTTDEEQARELDEARQQQAADAAAGVCVRVYVCVSVCACVSMCMCIGVCMCVCTCSSSASFIKWLLCFALFRLQRGIVCRAQPIPRRYWQQQQKRKEKKKMTISPHSTRSCLQQPQRDLRRCFVSLARKGGKGRGVGRGS